MSIIGIIGAIDAKGVSISCAGTVKTQDLQP